MKIAFYRDDGTVYLEQKLRSATVDAIKYGVVSYLNGDSYDLEEVVESLTFDDYDALSFLDRALINVAAELATEEPEKET